jgi:minimal PKS acyl carrier protein
MTSQQFSMSDLMDLLVASVGLPPSARTDDPHKTFEDIGLDSLAFLQLQVELEDRFGCPVDENSRPEDHVLGDLVDLVNAQPERVVR